MKKMTYAEHQYRKAYQMIREADTWYPIDPEYAAQVWSELNETVETSYYLAASRSSTLRTRQQKTGLNWWKLCVSRLKFGATNPVVTIRVENHIEQWFIPF